MTPRASGAWAGIIAAASLACAVRYGTYAPWGTDSAGYVEAAQRWDERTLAAPSPLALGFDWARSGNLVTPLAFRPGLETGTDVSIYPPGYPILMAAGRRLVGEVGAYLVAPACLFLLLCSTYAVASAVAGRWAGLLAATMLGVSPITLVSAIQPMSDIPACAFWVGAWALSLRPGYPATAAAGLAAAAAVAIRPNLAPLAVVPAALLWAGPGAREAWRGAAGRVALFFGAAAVGVALVGWYQAALYGHPLAPGYPGWEAFYRRAHIRANLTGYPRMLATVHSWVLVAALAVPLAMTWRSTAATRHARAVAWSAVAMALATFALYLPYLPYDDLHYLRFMLPAVAGLMVLFSAGVVLAARAASGRSRWLVALALLPVAYVGAAPTSLYTYATSLQASQQRVVLMGRYLQQALPRNAVVVSFLQSAALAHYTSRPVVRFDLLDTGALDGIVHDLSTAGYRPVIVVDDAEVPGFREKFSASPLGRLDWRPRARAIDTASSLSYFDPADRIAPAHEPDILRPPAGPTNQGLLR